MTTPANALAALEFERKYLIDQARRDAARHCLEVLCRPDSKYPVGIVTSIYFDTPSLRLLGEKVDSQLYKTKVRLRWYDRPEKSPSPERIAFLELKSRVGSRRAKWRRPVALAPAWLAGVSLSHPGLRRVPDLLDHDPTVAPRGLLPVLEVSYLRRRYRDPVTGCRVALDEAIEVTRVNPRLLAGLGRRRLPHTVLEIKSPRAEPPANLHFLRPLGARLTSFSKYQAAFAAAAASTLSNAHSPLHGQVA